MNEKNIETSVVFYRQLNTKEINNSRVHITAQGSCTAFYISVLQLLSS